MRFGLPLNLPTIQTERRAARSAVDRDPSLEVTR